MTIVTPNAEQIVLAQKDEGFRKILNGADIALPDGKPLEWLLRKHVPNMQRISGIDFMVDLCRAAAEKNSRVLLYGGRGGIARQALLELKKSIPNLDGIAMDGQELSETGVIDQSVIDSLRQTIRSRNIRIVFIGLGAPKQEYLMDVLKHTVQGPTLSGVYSKFVVMAVGGSFDLLAGKIARAPKVVQTIGFEWLWRLFQEPWRWKRQCALLKFIILVGQKKIYKILPSGS